MTHPLSTPKQNGSSEYLTLYLLTACRCRVVGSTRDPYEPHIPARAEWEQADDCPVHPLSPDQHPSR